MSFVMLHGRYMHQNTEREVLRAIYKGKIDLIEDYIKQGIDICASTEVENWTYLHRSLVPVSPNLRVNSNTIEFLISQGIDVNLKDAYGNTALQYASRSKNIEVVKPLLDSGADVNTANNEGITPLQHSFHSLPFSYELVELLLENGANFEHPLPLGDGSIKDLVTSICHGENLSIVGLLDKYSQEV